MSKFITLATAAVLEGIASVARMGAEYADAVQLMAAQCIAHAVEHGDVTLASKLVASVRPHHKATLVAFLEKNGPFRYQKADSAFEKNKSWDGVFDATTLPHWEKATKPAAIISMYDVDAALDAFIKQVRSKLDKAKGTKNKELLDRIESAQALYNAERMQDEAARIIEAEKARLEAVVLPPLRVAA